MRRGIWMAVLVVTLLGTATMASAAPKQAGPVDLEGELQGAAYEIRVPEDWNGTLVVYAHGYRDKADQPGEVDNTSASAFVADPFEEVMLDAGYAIAGSAYSDNGFAVREGVLDTKEVVNHFHSIFGRPDTTILLGYSMGSIITFESIEKYPGIYDGGIPACAVGAGSPRTFDGLLALSAAYDAVYGWPEAWGSPFDVRDDIDFETEVAPVLAAQLFAPDGPGKFEFIRRVTGISEGPEWPFGIWYFATEGRAELERRARGPVGQNADHTYELGAADRAMLSALGVSGSMIDGWIAEMMAGRTAEVPPSRQYVERYADYTGKLKRPVLTLHTAVDALVIPAHISAYNATVEAAGNGDLVANAWTSGFGHCAFVPAQTLVAVQAMEEWIKTGVKPTGDDFPAALGFVSVEPPEWPQP